ncbi:hypothetical protein BKA82DRAFT_3118663 [Pisolithus tinctorius]|nr:hypothetical protein BKA82DRAFT_3118663 [Pisolithus tinctorius]
MASSSTGSTPAPASILLRPVLLDNMFASSPSSSSSSSVSVSYRHPRIRFAPLPEPRRDDNPCTDGEDCDDGDETTSESETSEERDSLFADPSPSSSPCTTQSTPAVQSVSRASKLLRLFRLTSASTPAPASRDDDFRPRSRSPPPASSSSSSTILSRTTSLSSNHSRSTTNDPRRHSAPALGAGGGRHGFVSKMLSGPSPLSQQQQPASPSTMRGNSNRKPKHVRMLNGRIYGAKRHPVHSNANPFASARDEPEFVEWGYGGMGSVRASGDVANSVWKGLHANGSSGTLSHKSTAWGAGGGRSTASARRHMTQTAPECSMGSVAAGGDDEDDGSGMGWVKRRRAEREAKLKAEREAKERAEREAAEDEKEPRKSGESMSGDRTTGEHKDTGDHQQQQEHRVLATILRPLTNKQVQSGEPSPIESKTPSSPGDDDDDDEEVLDTHSRMARGAGVEKVSKHVNGVSLGEP